MAKKPSLDQRVRTDAKLRARVLKNPGLRAKLSDSTLQKYAPAQARQRTLSRRLAQPIAPGSSITERDLAHDAAAAQAVRYGPQESDLAQQIGRSQQIERDTGSYFAQYQQELQQHAAAVAAFQQGAQAALAQTAQGITGLAGTQAQALQQQANQAAAVNGVAPAGDLTGLASQALQTRQGLMGSFQGEQALQGAAANIYADTQARVVAPGQKLGALAQARGRTTDLYKKRSDLRTEEGAFNQQFRDQRRQDEFKNQLALGALNLQGAKAQADAAASTPQAQADAASARQSASTEASTAQKYGYSVHQWRMLGPDGRRRIINAARAQGKSKPDMGKVNKYGYTEAQWRAMSTQRRQQIIKDFGAKNGSSNPTGKGPDWQTNAQQGQGASDAVNLKDLAKKAKEGTKFSPGPKDRPGTGTKLNRQQAAQKIFQAAHVRDPALLSAALDAVYDGHLSPATVQKLINAGYKPSKIAQALGVPTAGNPAYRRRRLANAARRPGVQPLSPNPPRQ